jgi:hypothetical protein
MDDFDISDEHGFFLLGEAMAAFDRVLDARALIVKHGALIEGPSGALRPNPALVVERDSAARMLACLKLLNIDVEALRDGPGRPPG